MTDAIALAKQKLKWLVLILAVIAIIISQTDRFLAFFVQQSLLDSGFDVARLESVELTPGIVSQVDIRHLELSYGEPTNKRNTSDQNKFDKNTQSKAKLGHVVLLFDTKSLLLGQPLLEAIDIADLHIEWWSSKTSSPSQSENDLWRQLPVDTWISMAEDWLIEFDHPILKIDRANLFNSSIRYTDEDQDITLAVTSSSLTRSNDKHYNLNLDADLNRYPLILATQLRREANNTIFGVDGAWRDHSLKVSGKVAHIKPLTGLSANLVLESSSALPALALLGVSEVTDGNLRLNSHLTGNDNVFSWDAELQIGQLTLAGQLNQNLSSKNVDLEFQTAGPSLKEAGALVDYLGYENLPFSASGSVSKKGTLLSLHKSQIQLGDGLFSANGVMPFFPSLDDWQIELAADDFDISILQPLTQCTLPSIAMDWIGAFSTNAQGQETADIQLISQQQRISLIGMFDQAQRSSAIEVSAENIDTAPAFACIGIQPAEPLTVGFSIDLKQIAYKLNNDPWVIDKLHITSGTDTISATSNPEQLLDFKVAIANLQRIATYIPNFNVDLQPLALEAFFQVDIQKDFIRMQQGSIRSQLSSGVFNILIPLGTSSAGLTMDAEISGSDITEIFSDLPALETIQAIPFQYQGSLEITNGLTLATLSNFQLADNELFVEARLPNSNFEKDYEIKVKGKGLHLEKMFGMFVPYSLPPEPFEIAFDVHRLNNQLSIKQVDISVGKQQLVGNAQLDLASKATNSNGRFTLIGNSTHQLVKLMGLPTSLQDSHYQIETTIESRKDSIVVVLDHVEIGQSDLRGELHLDLSGHPQLNAKLHTTFLDLPTFFPSLDSERMQNKHKKRQVKPARLIPNVPLPIDWLDDINLEFDWNLDEIQLKPNYTATSNIAFTLRDGLLASDEISWQSNISDGFASIVAKQDATNPSHASISLDVVSQRIPAIWLLTGSPDDSDSSKLSFHAKLTSKGTSTLDLANNLNGAVLFRGGGGKLNSAKLDTLFGDFLFQVSSRVFSSRDKQTEILCTAGAFGIESGKIQFDPGLAIRTSRFDILASGNLKLPSEELKLRLTSRSRQGIGVSAANTLVPRVGISGTLAKPQFQFNARDTALSGGAAIASSGLSILASGLWDRFRTTIENPCDSLYTKAQTVDTYQSLKPNRQ